MPTLFRLVMLLGLATGVCWGLAEGMVTFLAPTQREIVQVVSLPQSVELTTGRSAAERLTGEAALLAHRRRRH